MTPVAGERAPWRTTSSICSTGTGSPQSEICTMGQDAQPLAGRPADAEVLAEPGHLARDPRRVAGMSETRVIRHRAEHVDVGGLRLQIDGELVEARAVQVGVAPGVVKRAEQRARARGVPDVAEFPHPVGEHIQPPADPLRRGAWRAGAPRAPAWAPAGA
ncbi:MAG: hypothetical protein MZV64_42745 [Ignavibacteriales bacterium]|nr:hypothetical protein [Ignavibacteriales bacterium]